MVRVAGGTTLREQAHRGQRRVHREPLLDQRRDRGQLGHPGGRAHARRGAVAKIPVELARRDQVIDESAIDPELVCDGGLGQTGLQQMLE